MTPGGVNEMTESSQNAQKPTREELDAILARFKDMTNQRGGVVIIGGVRPPLKREQPPDDKREEPENSKTGDS
jgi:hypothetical protein